MNKKKKTTPAPCALTASINGPPVAAKIAGKISPDERLEVTVRLRRKPGAEMPKVEGKPLTREEFRAAYGADPADIEKVEEFANEHGLDVVQSSIAQRAVRLSGTVEAMKAAFGVRFKAYRMTKTKQAIRGRTDTISVPKNLANIIEGVFGLDNRPQARPHFRTRAAKKSFMAQDSAAKPITPPQ